MFWKTEKKSVVPARNRTPGRLLAA